LVGARPDVAAIEEALLGGEGVNAAARRLGIAKTTLKRHLVHSDLKPAKVIRETPPPPPVQAPRLTGGAPCVVCASPDRKAIDEAILRGESPRKIEARFPNGPCDTSIDRHAKRCLARLVARAQSTVVAEVEETVRSQLHAQLGDLRQLQSKAQRLVEDAEGTGDPCEACGRAGEPAAPRDRAVTITAARGVFDSIGANLERIAKITGELRPAELTLQLIMASPHVVLLLEAVRRGLKHHPEARAAVAVELEALEQSQAPRLVGGA
jgi:hypothetical protein